VLAKIYLKEINNWNSPAIAALNPGITFPDLRIAVVHRSDSSGTTYIFTNYLSKKLPNGQIISVTPPRSIGSVILVYWQCGVAGQVKQIPGRLVM